MQQHLAFVFPWIAEIDQLVGYGGGEKRDGDVKRSQIQVIRLDQFIVPGNR